MEKKGQKLILNGYARDNYQRNKLEDGILKADDNDLIIVSDLDEIPNLKNVNFNSIKNKFDLLQYQKNIEENLINKIAEEIIIFINSM